MKALRYSLAAAVALTLAAPTVAQAGTLAPGFNGTTFPANDDGYVGPVAMGFSANYFGTTYASTYVSNNGYVTFGAGQSAYTPVGLGAAYSGNPIIAAFYADVDTRGAGSALTAYGTGTYAGHNAFGVTWNGVGYFGSHTDKLNYFQLILTDRSDTGTGNFDIYFNYQDIQWETGDASGGTGGFGGTAAGVGFNAGSGNAAGTYYELPGSRTAGTFTNGGTNPLIRQTNDGVVGQQYFQVRNGQVIVNPGAVPEPATWLTMILGFGLIGGALRSRKTKVAFAA